MRNTNLDMEVRDMKSIEALLRMLSPDPDSSPALEQYADYIASLEADSSLSVDYKGCRDIAENAFVVLDYEWIDSPPSLVNPAYDLQLFDRLGAICPGVKIRSKPDDNGKLHSFRQMLLHRMNARNSEFEFSATAFGMSIFREIELWEC